MLDNECDGYHPAFVHASIFSVADSGIGSLYGPKSTALTRDYGNGHTDVDLRPEFRRKGQPLGWFGTTAERLPDYVAKMEAAYGAETARTVMIDGTPHVMIFPNLFIAEIQIFVIQPLAANDTVQHVTALQFKGAPDLNRRTHGSPHAGQPPELRSSHPRTHRKDSQMTKKPHFLDAQPFTG